MTLRAWGRHVFALVFAVLLASSGSVGLAAKATADEAPKVLLLLDVSGSMNDKISSGGTKLAAAKTALKQVAASLPAGTQVGLRVYGSQIAEKKSVNPAACTDSQLVLPIGPLDRARMDTAVDSFQAKGETPIAYSLGKAVDDLGDSGKRVLVLVSDGEETCAGDPCPVAQKLADQGVDLQFNAIGLSVGSKARSQLQCIAKAGRGAYYDAGNTDSLNQALQKLTQRALRPFEVSGTPVEGTTDPAAAPQIGVGQYRDRYDASGAERFYTVNRTPGATVTASVFSVARPSGPINDATILMKLTTVNGELCSSSTPFEVVDRADAIYGGAVRSAFSEKPTSQQQFLPRGCADDPQLRLSLTRTSQQGGTAPVEIVVAEQGPITNAADLPESVGDYDGRTAVVAASSPVTPVVGGSAFSNAGDVGAGSWSDTVAYGETVLYRVRVDYGQRVRVTATVPATGRIPVDKYGVTYDALQVLTPARTVAFGVDQRFDGPVTAKLSVASPEVRALNGQLALPYVQNRAPDASTASVAGYYYIALQLRPYVDGLSGVVVPVRLDIAVDGTPSGQPVFGGTAASGGPTDGATQAAKDTAGRSGGALAVVGLGLALLIVVAAVVTALLLRRRRAR